VKPKPQYTVQRISCTFVTTAMKNCTQREEGLLWSIIECQYQK